MMQGQGVDAVDHVIPMPAVTGPIRTGDEEPMQNRQEDRPLYVEAKLDGLVKSQKMPLLSF